MSQDPVSVQVSIAPGTICSGGSTSVDFTFINDGASALVIEAPVIVMSGCCMDKWDLGTLDDVHIDAGGSVAMSAVVTAPQVAPGQYRIGIYGFTSSGGTLVLSEPSSAVDTVSAGATLLVDASGVTGAGEQVADALEALWAPCPTSVPGSRDVGVVAASHLSAVSMTAHISFESSAALPLSAFLGVAVMNDGHLRDWTIGAYSYNYSQAIILGADFDHLLGLIDEARLVPCVTTEPVPFTTVTTLPLPDGPDLGNAPAPTTTLPWTAPTLPRPTMPPPSATLLATDGTPITIPMPPDPNETSVAQMPGWYEDELNALLVSRALDEAVTVLELTGWTVRSDDLDDPNDVLDAELLVGRVTVQHRDGVVVDVAVG